MATAIRDAGDQDRQLPSDVMYNIFSRLPIKSLMRFRSVSKLWRELINDPQLSKLHTRKETVLLHHHAGTISVFTPHTSNIALMNLRPMFKSPEIKRCKVIAVGDGFLCLKREGSKPQKDIWYVVNPITKQVLKLPKPATECECPYTCAYGIGFDVSSGTLKVVRVCFPSYESGFSYTLGAEVYDFGERCWRRPCTSRVSIFPVRVLGGAVFPQERAISAKGGIHWFKENDLAGQGMEPKIVSFDLGKEEFSLLRPPKFKDVGSETGLFEVGGSLAIANNSLARRVEIWVLESGSKWTKRYKIELAAFPENFKVYVTPRRVRCVGKIDGQLVLVNFAGRHCFSFYSPKQRRSSRGFDFEHVPHVCLSHIFAFTPTLISFHL